MTGKDLIIYILQNNLENEEVIKDHKVVGLISAEEAAAKFNVGYYTVLTWYARGMLNGITIGKSLFFLHDIEDPRKKDVHE